MSVPPPAVRSLPVLSTNGPRGLWDRPTRMLYLEIVSVEGQWNRETVRTPVLLRVKRPGSDCSIFHG